MPARTALPAGGHGGRAVPVTVGRGTAPWRRTGGPGTAVVGARSAGWTGGRGPRGSAGSGPADVPARRGGHLGGSRCPGPVPSPMIVTADVARATATLSRVRGNRLDALAPVGYVGPGQHVAPRDAPVGVETSCRLVARRVWLSGHTRRISRKADVRKRTARCGEGLVTPHPAVTGDGGHSRRVQEWTGAPSCPVPAPLPSISS